MRSNRTKRGESTQGNDAAKNRAAVSEKSATLAISSIATALVLIVFTVPLTMLTGTAHVLGAGPGTQAWILSAISVGAAAGLLGSGAIDDGYGRRIFLAGTIALALMYSVSIFAAQPSNHRASAEPHAQTLRKSETSAMKIRLTVDGRSITATLIDNPTTRDFLSLLPLTLTLEDYASTEKIAYLPRKLSEEGAPAGVDPSVGDITYYAPWGNLALFYRDFGYAKGLIKLGNIDDGAEVFNVPGSVTVTIDSLKK
jgi:hypothetical protein